MSRDGYVEVSRAARHTLRAANAAKLTQRQHRALNAVIALTAGYSRISDRVYLATIAGEAYGLDPTVEDVPRWAWSKVAEDLRDLEQLGLIEREAPRGRPSKGDDGARYMIGLKVAPAVGASSGGGKSPRSSERKSPRSSERKSPRRSAPLPRSTSEKVSEPAHTPAPPRARAAPEVGDSIGRCTSRLALEDGCAGTRLVVDVDDQPGVAYVTDRCDACGAESTDPRPQPIPMTTPTRGDPR